MGSAFNLTLKDIYNRSYIQTLLFRKYIRFMNPGCEACSYCVSLESKEAL